ncbi:MAG: methyltransferase [Clostridia bacterium]|nr:methyltransferase [Clostridia bacterium]
MKPTAINENLSILQNEGSLAYGTDAYLLYAYIRRQSKERACELGAGSGVISLLLTSKQKFSHITAIEIQEKIADIARQNVEINGFSEKIGVVCADARTLPSEYNGTFGAVFSNPPYMSAVSGKINVDETDAISRHEICGGIRDFAHTASRLLKYGGLFYAVYRPDRLAELIAACKDAGLEPKRMTLVYPTAEHAPCLVLLEAKKNGAEGIRVTKPLIIYREGCPKTNENYTDDMKYIYQNGAFHELYQRL